MRFWTSRLALAVLGNLLLPLIIANVLISALEKIARWRRWGRAAYWLWFAEKKVTVGFSWACGHLAELDRWLSDVGPKKRNARMTN